jgi:hypothetical protein
MNVHSCHHFDLYTTVSYIGTIFDQFGIFH